ncbi:MAG: Hpt domain-containing protein [Acidobacteriota bacterium]
MLNPSNPSVAQPIDYTEVLERIGGDLSFLEELLKLYFEEYTEKRKRLQEAIERQDFAEIQELGHGLKGASANLSLSLLQQAALAMEMAGRERRAANAQQAFEALEREYARLRQFLAANPPQDAG